MAKLLDREATIKTVAVEIKALTVSGKQVTQALFKQLEEEPAIDFLTSRFNGLPWGRINYHAGCDGWQTRHIHVVWQKGDALRRSAVRESYEGERGFKLLMDSETRLYGVLAAWRLLDAELRPAIWNGFHWTGLDYARTYVSDPWAKVRLGDEEDGSCYVVDQKALTLMLHIMNSRSDQEKAEKQLVAATREAGFDTRNELLGAAIEVLERRQNAEQGWKHRYQELLDLDQLFIAV